jgi:arsenate reductase-like glutaredoxin family protein
MYGIKNCDTIKKARAWLDTRGIAYAFHDYKTAGLDRKQLEDWTREVGWEPLVNRAGTTFRKHRRCGQDESRREEGTRPDAREPVARQTPRARDCLRREA